MRFNEDNKRSESGKRGGARRDGGKKFNRDKSRGPKRDSDFEQGERKSFNPNFKPRFKDDKSSYGEKKDFHAKKGFDKKPYDPNAKYSKKKQTEFSKKSSNPNDPMRLNRFLANAGLCSRREADEYIIAGVVTVNGQVVDSLGAKVTPNKDRVLFHDQLVSAEKKVYVLLNKPKDCVTTTEDTNSRLTVLDLVRSACDERIYPVGRLDRNTTGVLLLTNDGDLAARLTHPKYNKKKVYHVALDKAVTKADMQKIAEGFELEDGFIKADAVNYVEEDDKKQVGIEIHSGRNRIVRRIFEHLGYQVVRLDRVYFAGLTKKKLSRGKWRHLTEKELNILRMGAYE